ncbi:MAG: protein-tyrosine-phosphatase [Actinophytocola sp.]|nr:protein-tyrosine-phosphatase [Actinophytocola sp.]
MRWINLQGAVNVRDLGGLPTADGRRTAEGKLLRSDNLQGLSPADVKTLVDEHRLSTVIDLRSTSELSSAGPGPLSAVGSVHHAHHSVLPEFGDSTDAGADALLTRRERNLTRYPDDFMCSMYLGYLEDRPESVVGALRSIGESDGAVVVHCAAGKDRTGVVIAMTLTVIGVRAEAVVADYAATAQRISAILDRLRASSTYADDIDRIPAEAHTPRAETMAAFLEQLRVRYGGAQEWLDAHGFGEPDVVRLRDRLLDTSDQRTPHE